MYLVTGLFFLVFLLNQRCSPLLRFQASHCSTFRIMCDVPSIAVFCSEPIECFPGTASNFLLKLLVTIPVAPVFTGIIIIILFTVIEALGGADCRGTALQVGRSRVRFPVVSLEFFIDIILPASLWPWGRHSA